jgi:microcystin-dependent protein
MAQPYVGEIRMFGGSFAPAGWMFCDGQLLPISENETLFQLIGTTYGGDGQSTFQLPDLRSRIPIHVGPNLGPLAATGGTETVTLTTQQIPIHSHPFLCSGNNADSTQPTNNVAGVVTVVGVTAYGTDAPPTNLNANSISPIGGSQPHENMQPYLCISFIISLFGIFPPPS